MARRDDPNPKLWGKRPYCDKEARGLLNDISERIARNEPDHIDDPAGPSLADVFREQYRQRNGDAPTALTLTEMMRHDVDFEEAVVWYFYRVAGYDLAEIHDAIQGGGRDGAPVPKNSLRNIHRILKTAASKLPDADPANVPDIDDLLADAAPAAEPTARG